MNIIFKNIYATQVADKITSCSSGCHSLSFISVRVVISQMAARLSGSKFETMKMCIRDRNMNLWFVQNTTNAPNFHARLFYCNLQSKQGRSKDRPCLLCCWKPNRSVKHSHMTNWDVIKIIEAKFKDPLLLEWKYPVLRATIALGKTGPKRILLPPYYHLP